jgi:hypothetical protein
MHASDHPTQEGRAGNAGSFECQVNDLATFSLIFCGGDSSGRCHGPKCEQSKAMIDTFVEPSGCLPLAGEAFCHISEIVDSLEKGVLTSSFPRPYAAAERPIASVVLRIPVCNHAPT